MKNRKRNKPSRRQREEYYDTLVLSPSEPVSEELQQVARMRRATINPSAVDKHVIRGSMAKVVSSGSSNVPMGRLLR